MLILLNGRDLAITHDVDRIGSERVSSRTAPDAISLTGLDVYVVVAFTSRDLVVAVAAVEVVVSVAAVDEVVAVAAVHQVVAVGAIARSR